MFFIFGLIPEQASSVALKVDLLYFYLVAVSVFFSVLIFALVFFFAIRYRRKNEDEKPKAIHGNNLLETIWTVIPLLFVTSFFILGVRLFFENSIPPKDALEIFVVGKQWMWKIQHPEGPREINELHVPVGRAVKLKMTSEDVIHSFYVPAFRTKMDVLPGRYTTAWFKPSKTGRFHLFCAEYCGTKHAGMGGWIIVMPETDYEKWLENAMSAPGAGGVSVVSNSGGSLTDQGAALFTEYRCITCHHGNSAAIGANLDGLYGSKVTLTTGQTVLADDNYLRESILKPRAKIVSGFEPLMPTYEGQLNEEQIMALIAYLKSRSASPESGEPAKGQVKHEPLSV